MLPGKVYIGGSATSFMFGGGLSGGSPLTFEAQNGANRVLALSYK